MPRNQRDLQRQHELAVAWDFVSYLRVLGLELGDPRIDDTQGKGEPDAVSDSPDGPIGIEVADAYYHAVAARELWRSVRGESLPRPLAARNPDLELTRGLNRTLRKQCKNKYTTATTYLILNVTHAALTVLEDADLLRQHLDIPADCSFSAVYLRLKANYSATNVFVQVWPVRRQK